MKDFWPAAQAKTAQGFYPILITATGGGANTNVSAIFEQPPFHESTELTIDLDAASFRDQVARRAELGWIARTGTIHDDSAHAWRAAMIWERNTGAVA